MKNLICFTWFSAICFLAIPFSSCSGDSAWEAHFRDSLRVADSLQMEQLRIDAEAAKKNVIDIQTFDFTGTWTSDIMTFIFYGDSAEMKTVDDTEYQWYKVVMDRNQDPAHFDLIKVFDDGTETLGFSMIVRVDDENKMSIGFGEDMTVRPAEFSPDHTVPFTRASRNN